MHPAERLLGEARRLQLRGLPIPLTMLAEADKLGLSLTLFNEPTHNANSHEGDIHNGTEETDCHDT